MEYQSFAKFIDIAVLPHRVRNPEWIRLDGARSGGNLEPFGFFRHRGGKWRVNSDTHFEPLLIAYEALSEGRVNDPFQVGVTKSGPCLILIPSLQQLYDSPHKHLYIYAT